MKSIIFLLVLALVGSEHTSRYDPTFSENSLHTYRYEGVILTGLPERGLTKAGVRLSSKVKIRGIGQRQYLLQIVDPWIQELTGIWPKDPFTSARKLTARWAVQLTKPVKFEYNSGRVGAIYSPASLPGSILNIHKGIINLFQITIKKSQNFYDLQEDGIGGTCHTRYVVQEDRRKERLTITKSKNMNNCQERAEENLKASYSETCTDCPPRHTQGSQTVTTSTLILKPTAYGAILQEARVHEVHQFTQNGEVQVDARQSLILEHITSEQPQTLPELPTRHSLRYHSDRSAFWQPFTLIREQNLVLKIKETLNHIAKHNTEEIHHDAPSKFLELIQLLRSVEHTALSEVWALVKSRTELRRWFIEALPAVGTFDSLKWLKTRIQNSELTRLEVLQTLILALSQVNLDRKVIILALDIIELIVIKENWILRRFTVLTYGSLVYRFCSPRTTCPDDILKPLHNLLTEGVSQRNNENIVLGLKAIGNAGQPASIKNIVKLLPGFGTMATSLPLKVRVDAIMALTNIGRKDPKTVQRISMQLFLNRKNHPEERMMACAVLFQTKPPLTLVTIVANSMLTETSLQVASFTYSHIRALSRSTVPDLYQLSSACKLALNLLSPKLEQLGLRFSKVFHEDKFLFQLMAGLSGRALLIKSSSTIIPTALIAKIRGYRLQSTSDILEVGLRAEGLQDFIMKSRASNVKVTENRSMKRILSKIVNWKDVPEEELLASAYTKVFGQELLYSHLNKDSIEAFGKYLTAPLSSQWKSYLRQLSNGVSFQMAKAVMMSELRYVVPSTVGFPLEMSLVTLSLSVAKGTLEARSDPAITKLPQLMMSRIQVKARWAASVHLYSRGYIGINMPEIQSGVEINVQACSTLPVDITAKINMKEGNMRIDSSPAQKTTRVFTVESQFVAISRNIENLPGEKIVPILPMTSTSSISSQKFKSASVSTEVQDDSVVAQVTPETLSDQIPCSAEDGWSFISNHALYRACTEAPMIGVLVCVDAKRWSAPSVGHLPLYQLIGHHQLNITTSPLTSEADIEKIVLEIQTGSRSLSKLMKLDDKEAKIDRTTSEMEQNRLRRILMKTSGEGTRHNSTLSRRKLVSSSSSSSSQWSRSSRVTRSWSSSRRLGATVEPRTSWRKASRVTASVTSSRSSSSRLQSWRASRKMASSQQSKSWHSSSRSWAAIRRHQGGITVSNSQRPTGSSRIIRIGVTSGLKQSSGSSLLQSSNQRYLVRTAGSPFLVILLRARRTDGVQQGYQLTGYGKMSSRLPRIHLRLVELDQKSNWMVCLDALVPSSHKVMTLARWGDNCEKYKVSTKLSSGKLASHPAIRLKMQWRKISEELKRGAKLVGDYIPELAYSLGFSQTYRRNPSHRITALVALTSSQTLDTIIRWPSMTVYYQGLQLPTTVPVHTVSRRMQEKGFSSITEIPELLLKMNERECAVENGIVRTFDGKELDHQLSNDCYYILSQDCSESPKFMLLVKRSKVDKTKWSIRLILSTKNTTIDLTYMQQRTKIEVNGVEYSPNDKIPSLEDILKIESDMTGVTVRIPVFSIEWLFFDGNKIKMALDQMMGKTCGLCGLNNGEKKLIMSNQEEARDVDQLFESWLYPGTSCKDDCRVRREFVALGRAIEFEGHESKCYSVEPVQQCLAQCTPLETRSRHVNFHCVPSNYTVTDTSLFNKKSVDITHKMDTHTDCLCKCL
ncbi:vitellogenin-like [Mobula birostris]|uniref:vitellogenin-like n=1 Tax=Mobula birostris TaxID=1983395 RepID=UPI003B28C904